MRYAAVLKRRFLPQRFYKIYNALNSSGSRLMANFPFYRSWVFQIAVVSNINREAIIKSKNKSLILFCAIINVNCIFKIELRKIIHNIKEKYIVLNTILLREVYKAKFVWKMKQLKVVDCSGQFIHHECTTKSNLKYEISFSREKKNNK